MASVLVIMPLGAVEPKASSNLRFCSVRWMSLRVWSLSAEPIGAGFHTEALRHGAWDEQVPVACLGAMVLITFVRLLTNVSVYEYNE
jgi:hypothetical protein